MGNLRTREAWRVLAALVSLLLGTACIQVSEEPASTKEPAPHHRAPTGPCSDPTTRLIYALGAKGLLYAFDPASGTYTKIASVDCKATGSIAVDRDGVVYIDAGGGDLYRLDPMTGKCDKTGFGPSLGGFIGLSTAFASEPDGGEAFFGAWSSATAPLWTTQLGVIDPLTPAWTVIGSISGATFDSADMVIGMTGGADGLLFALMQSGTAGNVWVVRVDPRTATELSRDPLWGVYPKQNAFAVWGGEFYLFHACERELCRINPTTREITPIAAFLDDEVVAAGVSTCAPL